MSRRSTATVEIIVLVCLIAAGFAIDYNRYGITDWYILRSYTPSAGVASLATQATMTAKGRRLFYRADPQIVTERATMVAQCQMPDNQVAELGCYLSTDHIYLLQISDPALASEMATTAGYEMLHSAYQRMSDSQRRTVNTQMERVAATITDPDILSQLQVYAQVEPGARDDELYSVLGTEYPTIPASLAANYAQYFTDRAQLVANYQQFNRTFDALHAQITQLGDQIDAQKAAMQRYLDSGQIALYNARVPTINAQISTYNADVGLYNQYGREILGTESSAGAQ